MGDYGGDSVRDSSGFVGLTFEKHGDVLWQVGKMAFGHGA